MSARSQISPSLVGRSSLLLLSALSISAAVACTKEKKESKADSSAATQQAQKPAAPAGPLVDSMTFPQLPEMPQPETNPTSPEKVELGHRLFFEKRLSVDDSVSCYSCHQNEQGNGGKEPLAVGAQAKQLTRHSPVIWNVGYLPALYWDGRSDSLEGQAKGAWGGGNMGVGKDNLDKKAKAIAALPEYKEAFKKAFPDTEIGADQVAQALSAYERTLVCNDTAYDKYAAGDKSALSDEQKKGLELFTGKAMCVACHAPPFFSAAYMGKGAFFNVGIGTKDREEKDVDVGRMAVSEDEKDWAAFKVPTLRNVSKSAPYFHDGSIAELKDAVKFMAGGGHDNKNKTPLMTDKQLSEAEISQIVSFLGALDCGGSLQQPQ